MPSYLVTRTSAALLAVGACCACASTRTTRFDSRIRYPERTPAESIRFYGAQPPACAYEELGRVTAESHLFVTWGRVVAAARKAAHELGGDAIIGVKEGSRLSVDAIGDVPSVSSSPTLSGIVVRFQDESCMS